MITTGAKANDDTGKLVWLPTREALKSSNQALFIMWLEHTMGLSFAGYDDLWRWSVAHIDDFWAAVADYFQVRWHTAYTSVLTERAMPGTDWFRGGRLNFAEHLLLTDGDRTAIIHASESGDLASLTYGELRSRVAVVQTGLRKLGVKRGDRVAAYLPNIPETAIAFLACAGLGAVWSICSPDFGPRAVVDRFKQIRPKVLLAVDGYYFGGQQFDRRSQLREIVRQLSSLQAVVVLPMLGGEVEAGDRATDWNALFCDRGPLVFESVGFSHPLWVVYSSGTTGLPKGMVHGHGGALLEFLVNGGLHLDLRPDDRFFWFSTTGWVMWNILVGGLATGSTIVLYDGSPASSGLEALWRFAEAAEVTFFGTSPAFIQSCMKAGLTPRKRFDLSKLRVLGSTGAPLVAEAFEWVQAAVKPGIFIANISGGTDVCGAFAASSPLLPVYAGELQCRALGVKLEAYDDRGRALIGEVGELVVAEPMPSMPVRFWNDPHQVRYRESYFNMYPGVWRHGDWIKITDRGSAIIYGRSDSTLNRGGVRMGTSDFYRVVEDLPGVTDSLIIDTGRLGAEGRLILFIVLAPRVSLDDALRRRINATLRTQLSPRHVADEIYVVPEIPRTINGKKLEVPLKRIWEGDPPGSVLSEGAMSNPQLLDFFIQIRENQISS